MKKLSAIVINLFHIWENRPRKIFLYDITSLTKRCYMQFTHTIFIKSSVQSMQAGQFAGNQMDLINQSMSMVLEHVRKDYFSVLDSNILCYTFDSAHATIIETLMNHHYFKEEIPTLIEFLSDRDFTRKFYGIIGLNRFSKILVNPANEVQIFDTGIMVKLIDLLYQHEFPFLQYSSLTLLISLEKLISRENYSLYFGQVALRCEIILQLFQAHERIYSYFNHLCERLKDRSLYFNYTDDNTQFLNKIIQIIRTKPLSQPLLIRLCLTISNIIVYSNGQGSRNFFRLYFKILDILLDEVLKIESKKLIKLLVIEFISQNSTSITNSNLQVEEFRVFLRKIIDIYVQKEFDLSQTILGLAKAGKLGMIISSQQFFGKISSNFDKFINNSLSEDQLVSNLDLMLIFLSKGTKFKKYEPTELIEKRKALVSETNIFTALPILYAKESNRITKQLNNFICLLIRHSYNDAICETVVKMNLISLFFENCSTQWIKEVATKVCLKDFYISLQKLKSFNKESNYQKICGLVAQQDIIKKVKKIKDQNNSLNASTICKNILDLFKEEVNQQFVNSIFLSCEKRDQRQGSKKVEMNEIGIQTLLNFENIEDIV